MEQTERSLAPDAASVAVRWSLSGIWIANGDAAPAVPGPTSLERLCAEGAGVYRAALHVLEGSFAGVLLDGMNALIVAQSVAGPGAKGARLAIYPDAAGRPEQQEALVTLLVQRLWGGFDLSALRSRRRLRIQPLPLAFRDDCGERSMEVVALGAKGPSVSVQHGMGDIALETGERAVSSGSCVEVEWSGDLLLPDSAAAELGQETALLPAGPRILQAHYRAFPCPC